jgi:hypothetical protein
MGDAEAPTIYVVLYHPPLLKDGSGTIPFRKANMDEEYCQMAGPVIGV